MDGLLTSMRLPNLYIFCILILFIINQFQCNAALEVLHNVVEAEPEKLKLIIHETASIRFTYKDNAAEAIRIQLHHDDYLKIDPSMFVIDGSGNGTSVEITGEWITSRSIVEVANCSERPNNSTTWRPCSFNTTNIFVLVEVSKSDVIAWLVLITGWIYFLSWSISFYPQILLNYQRKSVVGLNFDFLVLNIIGFTCYTVYNVLLYFDENIQSIYVEKHPRSLIPVLLNDVVFSGHALFACIVTGLQCLIYERSNQRVSYICRGWSSLLVVFSFISLLISCFGLIDWLEFVTYLSYVKMAVTLSKYLPQGILNFKRKSTVGWSIGNVLLDFTGGATDILQMILQASNTSDWSAFYGNPVKFGLGLVSMLFDIFFIIQHYVLYRHSEEEITSYDQVETNDGTSSTITGGTSPVQSNNEIRA